MVKDEPPKGAEGLTVAIPMRHHLMTVPLARLGTDRFQGGCETVRVPSLFAERLRFGVRQRVLYFPGLSRDFFYCFDLISEWEG